MFAGGLSFEEFVNLSAVISTAKIAFQRRDQRREGFIRISLGTSCLLLACPPSFILNSHFSQRSSFSSLRSCKRDVIVHLLLSTMK